MVITKTVTGTSQPPMEELPDGIKERAGNMLSAVRKALGDMGINPNGDPSTSLVAEAASSCLLYLAIQNDKFNMTTLPTFGAILSATSDSLYGRTGDWEIIHGTARLLGPSLSHAALISKTGLMNEDRAITKMVDEARKITQADPDGNTALLCISERYKSK
jgi:hypothetical protein